MYAVFFSLTKWGMFKCGKINLVHFKCNEIRIAKVLIVAD